MSETGTLNITNRKNRIFIKKNNFLIYFFLCVGSFGMISPFLWMLFTSFKTVAETTMIPPKLFPESFLNINSYVQATTSLPFINLYYNTLIMIVVRVICAIIFSSMAGYAFAKVDFPLKKLLFAIVISQLMFPPQIFILPQYEIIAKLKLNDTILALVFPGLVSAFGTFFLRQTHMGIPNDIIEAARIDGCNHFKIFYHIAIPLTKTAMAALAIFTALFAYADLMWPLIVNTKSNMLTLSSGLATLRGQFAVNYPNLMAGSVLAMIPMIVIYLIFQKQFIQGIAMTGTKS